MTSRACFEPSIFAKNGPPDLEGCSSLLTLGKMRILVCLTLRVRPLSLLVHGVQAYEVRYLVVDKRSDHQGPACYRVTKHAESVECPWDITKCILSFRSPHILTSRRSEHISDRSATHATTMPFFYAGKAPLHCASILEIPMDCAATPAPNSRTLALPSLSYACQSSAARPLFGSFANATQASCIAWLVAYSSFVLGPL